jgi:hypothetical protein
LIADGTFWDYKSSEQTRIVRREDIWQLAAYLLADSDDDYQLNSVGISALRWRRRYAWAAGRFLGVLSGHPPADVDLARWRRRIAAVVVKAG